MTTAPTLHLYYWRSTALSGANDWIIALAESPEAARLKARDRFERTVMKYYPSDMARAQFEADIADDPEIAGDDCFLIEGGF